LERGVRKGDERGPVELVEQLAAAEAEPSNRAMALLSSASAKKRWLRQTRQDQRSTTCTPTSTLALSRGRAGRIAVP
jgi:hypothetical protein